MAMAGNDTKEINKAKRSRKQYDADAYGQGCETGHREAVAWILDRQRQPVSILGTGLQQVMLCYLEDYSKARGAAKKSHLRGRIVGFFSMIENPERAMRFREAAKRRLETGAESFDTIIERRG